MLSVLENNYVMAQVLAEQDNRLTNGTFEIHTPNGPIQVYFAKKRKVSFWNHYLNI